MTTKAVFAAALLLAASAAPAQWLETQINLNDSAWPHDLVYNPQDNKVYCANYGTDNITIVDGATNGIIATVAAGAHPNALCYNSVNDRIYCANSGATTVSVIDGASNAVIATTTVGNTPLDLCYNAQNNKVYCANQLSNSVSVLDGGSNAVIATVPVGYGPEKLLYYAPANKVFVANGVGSSITVIDGASNSVLATIPANVPGPLGSNPDNDKVYCVSVNRNRLYVIDGSSNTLLDSVMMGFNNIPREIAYCPVNHKAYVAVNAGTFSWVMVIDGATNARVDSIPVNPLPNLILYNPHTDKMLTADDGPATVSVISCATNTVSHSIPIDTAPDCMCWNPAYNRVYVGCYVYLPYPPVRTSSICVIRDSGGGVAESHPSALRGRGKTASIVRGVLDLGTLGHDPNCPGAIGSCPAAALLDAAGCRVLALGPGANDLSGLRAGVYFVRTEDAALPQKVVLAR